MTYKELFYNSKNIPAIEKIIIVGVNPLIEFLEDDEAKQFFADLLRCNDKLRIYFLYESETENFNQSLFYDKKLSKNKIDFVRLSQFRERLIGEDKKKVNKEPELVEDILRYFDKDERDAVNNRIFIMQNNLRHNVNLIIADDVIRYSFTTLEIPSIECYVTITEKTHQVLYNQLKDSVSFLLDKDSGGKFLSEPGEELIQMYDLNNIPRAIAPRKVFYTLKYQRSSIWAFVFNRKGELLLHKRSDFTADNRSLWDKSAGGHVDIKDSSTILTAKREVIEELFLAEAEYTKFMSPDYEYMIDFGEWNTKKRPEKYFKSDFDALASDDWVIFRAVKEQTGKALTVQRKSQRIMHVADLDNGKKIPLLDEKGNKIIKANGKPAYQEHIERWNTRFISDVYMFIAPEGYIDTEEQMHELMANAEIKGAASAHRIISIDDLIDDVEENSEQYTDDMVYMITEYSWLLTRFSEFIKYIFKQQNK